MNSVDNIVSEQTDSSENLKEYGKFQTRRQWRKDHRRRVKKGEKPAGHLIMSYMGHRTVGEIATDGTVTEWVEPCEKKRRIPLFSFEQTVPYKRFGAQILRDMYSRYFVDDAKKANYVWWHPEEGQWKWCRGHLDDEKVRLHLCGKEIYGIVGGERTCFSAIDGDYHGGDYGIFKDQVGLVLKNIHGQDGWHYSISARGLHFLRTHPRLSTDSARANLRKLLTEIDAQDSDLHQRAVEAGLRPISQWEVYPDPKQGFRLPLARERITLLEHPHDQMDLETYIRWQRKPTYCSVEEALATIFTIIQPAEANSKEKHKARTETKGPKTVGEIQNVFGPLKGRYTQVLVGFWAGKHNPPDSLNCAIAITARVLPYYYDDPGDAVAFLEGLIDALPDVSFSDRLTNGKRNEVSTVVRSSVKAVYDGNGHQPHPELSTSKLDRVITAWRKRGFSLVDRSTWDRYGGNVSVADDFSWTPEDTDALMYFSKILHTDLQTCADATRHLFQVLRNHPTGVMSVSYVKKLLASFKIKVGHHGKVNEYLSALSHAGWISQIAGHSVGHKGRQWEIGPKMRQKLPSSSTLTTKPPSPSIYYCPISEEDGSEGVINEVTHPTLGETVGGKKQLRKTEKIPGNCP